MNMLYSQSSKNTTTDLSLILINIYLINSTSPQLTAKRTLFFMVLVITCHFTCTAVLKDVEKNWRAKESENPVIDVWALRLLISRLDQFLGLALSVKSTLEDMEEATS